MGFETPSLHAADTVTASYALILFIKHSNLYAARIGVLCAVAYAAKKKEKNQKNKSKPLGKACAEHTKYAGWKKTKCN